MKCENYYIVKVRYYADAKLLSQPFVTNEQRLQHHTRANHIGSLYWEFFEFVTGYSMKAYVLMIPNFLRSREDSKEYLLNEYGIYIDDGEANRYFYIPKTSEKYYLEFLYFLSKYDLPYKVLKKKKYVRYLDDRLK